MHDYHSSDKAPEQSSLQQGDDAPGSQVLEGKSLSSRGSRVNVSPDSARVIRPEGIYYVCETKASTGEWFHINRTAGGDCDYRDPGSDVVASAGQSEGKRQENELHQQPPSNGVRIVDVCR